MRLENSCNSLLDYGSSWRRGGPIVTRSPMTESMVAAAVRRGRSCGKLIMCFRVEKHRILRSEE
jgi:hypothetical protein